MLARHFSHITLFDWLKYNFLFTCRKQSRHVALQYGNGSLSHSPDDVEVFENLPFSLHSMVIWRSWNLESDLLQRVTFKRQLRNVSADLSFAMRCNMSRKGKKMLLQQQNLKNLLISNMQNSVMLWILLVPFPKQYLYLISIITQTQTKKTDWFECCCFFVCLFV